MSVVVSCFRDAGIGLARRRKKKERRVSSNRRSHAISTKVFVGNLNFRTTEEQLSETFSVVGEVRNVHIPTDRETGRPRGFAFVEFSSGHEAAQAIERFDGQELDGRKLRVNLAQDRPYRSSGTPRSSANPSTPGWAQGAGGAFPYRDEPRNLKTKGSRRNLRARKRSLNY